MVDSVQNCKVVLVGESGVGKTCINNRFLQEEFYGNEVPTTAASFATKEITYEEYMGKTIKFEVWDTAGQEQYHSLGKIFFKGAQAAILVYEITNLKSFEGIKNFWYNQLRDYASKNIDKSFFI